MDETRDDVSYFAVIPADVRYDSELPASAKLLYGELSALIRKGGFCTKGNAYFADLYGLTSKSISRLISCLEKGNYITTQLVRDKSGKVLERKIYLRVSLPDIQPVDNFGDTPPQKCPGGIPKNEEYINTSNSNIKDPHEDHHAKRDNPCLSDKQIKDFCIQWITQHGTEWTNSEKNSLYALCVGFYSPRETKKETPSRTLISVKTLFSRLLSYSNGNPAIMRDMLERAITGKWKSVFPPASTQSRAGDQTTEEKVEWL